MSRDEEQFIDEAVIEFRKLPHVWQALIIQRKGGILGWLKTLIQVEKENLLDNAVEVVKLAKRDLTDMPGNSYAEALYVSQQEGADPTSFFGGDWRNRK